MASYFEELGVVQPAPGAASAEVSEHEALEAELNLQAAMRFLEIEATQDSALVERMESTIKDADPELLRRPPASQHVLQALPTTTITGEMLGRLQQSAECAICKCDYVAGEQGAWLPIPGCGHSFHAVCITAWLAKYNFCPCCRRELPTDDPDYVPDGGKQGLHGAYAAELPRCHTANDMYD